VGWSSRQPKINTIPAHYLLLNIAGCLEDLLEACEEPVGRLDWVRKDLNRGHVIFFRFLGGTAFWVPEAPQRRASTRRGNQATAETVVKDQEKFLEQQIREYRSAFGIQQRQDHDKERRKAFHPIVGQGGQLKILCDGPTERSQFCLEFFQLTWSFRHGRFSP
jgi:hypothetical protein